MVANDGRALGMQVSVAGESRLSGRARHCAGQRRLYPQPGDGAQLRSRVIRLRRALGQCGRPGHGNQYGYGAGAAALRMHQGFAIVPLYPPESVLAGIVVNASGQRFIAEDTYYGMLGDAIAYHQQGRAWLLTDHGNELPAWQDNFLPVAQANTIGDLADQLGFPKAPCRTPWPTKSLRGQRRRPVIHKRAALLRPVQGPPYRAWDLAVDKSFVPAHTFGGLHPARTAR